MHGRSRWLAGSCRCEKCRHDLCEYAQTRRAVQAVRAGRAPQVRMPATRARRSLDRLRSSGLSLRAIAEQSGVSVGALQHLQQRDRAHVALTTVQRLERCRP